MQAALATGIGCSGLQAHVRRLISIRPSFTDMHSTLASNAIVVVLATTVAYAERDSHNGTLFTLVGPIPSGLPTPQAPSIDPARFQVHK